MTFSKLEPIDLGTAWKCPRCERIFEAGTRDDVIFHQGHDENCKVPEPKGQFPPDVEFFLDQFGAAFCRLKKDEHFKIFPVKSRDFKRVASSWIMNAGKRPSTTALATVCAEAEGRAYSEGNVYPLHIRSARTADGALWIDLCNDSWSAIRIDSSGWKIETEPPILFRRFSHMKKLSVATSGTITDLNNFCSGLNFATDEDRKLFGIYLILSFLAGIPRPIMILHGAQGSAKSSLLRATRDVVDASEIPLLSIPRDQNELAQVMMHHYAPGFDNIHTLSQWASDSLCRACTGEGFSKRELFSDDGDVVFKFQRLISLNGISVPSVAPDLLDRAILFGLERIPEEHRKTEAEMAKIQLELLPRVRAFTFEILSKSFVLRENIKLAKLPRMADFAIWGECVARAMGWEEGVFLKLYADNRKRQTQEIISGSFVGELLVSFMEPLPEWEGSPSELHSALETFAIQDKRNIHDRAWPKNPQTLMRKINLLKTTLADSGLLVEISHSGTRCIKLRKIASNPSNASNNVGKKLDAFMDAIEPPNIASNIASTNLNVGDGRNNAMDAICRTIIQEPSKPGQNQPDDELEDGEDILDEPEKREPVE